VISLASAHDRARWNGYVERHPHASVYHRWEWLEVFERTYGARAFPLMARYGGAVTGVLPLVRVGPPGTAGKLVALPWFGHGGAVADDDATWRCLLDAAGALRGELGAAHVELRHAHEVPAGALPTREGKVLMRLDVSVGEEALLKAVGAKTRADVRRPEKEGMTAHVGGAELVGEFHAVYADVMRDLGSPSHARALFEGAARAMPDRTFVVVVRYEGGAVGGGFLAGMGDTLEIPCAGTRHGFARLRGNMLLYWTVIREAMRRGYRSFSFGRSSEDSGTYTFKKNWGARPTPLPYHYLLPPDRTLPASAGESPVLARVSDAWKRLPVGLTERVGPRLVRWLP
jgi:FemAB-related protein (PEP-CTERM system-associated)